MVAECPEDARLGLRNPHCTSADRSRKCTKLSDGLVLLDAHPRIGREHTLIDRAPQRLQAFLGCSQAISPSTYPLQQGLRMAHCYPCSLGFDRLTAIHDPRHPHPQLGKGVNVIDELNH